MSRSFWRPKQPRWALASGIAAAASLAVYTASGFLRPPDPGRGVCLWFGILAAALFLVEALYPLRRRLLARPLPNAQQWVQLHIWGGVLSLAWVLMHGAFRKPVGTLGWLLLLLTIWVTLSGLVGVFVQKYYPVMLSRNLSVEALFDRIPDLVGRLPGEADKLVDGGSEVLRGFYLQEVRPALAGVQPSWSYLSDVRGGRDRRLLSFTRISAFLPEEERPRLEDLKTIFIEKLELDAQYSVQRALRMWTWLHVPPAAVLLGLVIVHIVVVLVY